MKKIVFFIFVFTSFVILANPDESYFHVFYGAGEIYSTPGTVRAGRKNWEVGLLNQRSIGYTRLFYQDKYYAAAGAIFNQNGSLGTFGGVGMEWYFWKFFSFRGEANTSYGLDNYSHSEVVLGLTFAW